MRIPEKTIRKFISDTWKKPDTDTITIMRSFDEPEGSKILEIGAHDEPVSNILSDLGFKVTGVDLREYDKELPPCNYEYVRCDFCNLPFELISKWWEYFDSAVSISAIEHFGLNAYREGNFYHFYYDVIAMRTVWQLLKFGGSCYVTMPFGKNFVTAPNHWRSYNMDSMGKRIVQDFDVEWDVYVVSGYGVEIDRKYQVGEIIERGIAIQYEGQLPHVSIITKLRKNKVNRLAPDGR